MLTPHAPTHALHGVYKPPAGIFELVYPWWGMIVAKFGRSTSAGMLDDAMCQPLVRVCGGEEVSCRTFTATQKYKMSFNRVSFITRGSHCVI